MNHGGVIKFYTTKDGTVSNTSLLPIDSQTVSHLPHTGWDAEVTDWMRQHMLSCKILREHFGILSRDLAVGIKEMNEQLQLNSQPW